MRRHRKPYKGEHWDREVRRYFRIQWFSTPEAPSPPPPPDPIEIPELAPSDEEIQAAKKRRRLYEVRRKGSSYTMLTGGRGATGPLPVLKRGGVLINQGGTLMGGV